MSISKLKLSALLLLIFSTVSYIYLSSGPKVNYRNVVSTSHEAIFVPMKKRLHSSMRGTNLRRNSRLDNSQHHPLLTSCADVDWATKKRFRSTQKQSSMTLDVCRETCARQGVLYATLSRGVCTCEGARIARKIVNMKTCNATCPNEELNCNLETKPQVISMRTGYWDGNRDWTVWMSVPNMNTKVRYRGCYRNKENNTKCRPEFDRAPISSTSSMVSGYKKLIGCFTSTSVLQNISIHRIQSLYGLERSSFSVCISFCSDHQTRYALTEFKRGPSRGVCYCTDSLALSRPSNTCPSRGVIAFFTFSKESSGILQFDKEVTKTRKVLLLSRDSPGPYKVKSLFSGDINSLALLKPEVMTSTSSQSDAALLKGLESFYQCDIVNLPQLFFSSELAEYSLRKLKMVNNLHQVSWCYGESAEFDCDTSFLEACEKSSLLNVITTKDFTAEAIHDFIQRNPDVNVVFVVQDPRDLELKQEEFGLACNQLVAVGKKVAEMKTKGYKNAHVVFYEQLAANPSYYKAQIQRLMNTGNSLESIDDSLPESQTSTAHLAGNTTCLSYRFLERYSIAEVLDIDKVCTDVYSIWPDHYTDLTTMYRRDQDGLTKCLPANRIPEFENYIKTKKNWLL